MSRTAPADRDRPAFAAEDADKVAILSLLALLAWTVPSREWRRVALALASWRPGPLAGRRRREAEAIPPFLLRLMDVSPAAAADHFLSTYYEQTLQVFRLHRPGGWRPAIRVRGFERVEEALARGRGVIVWPSFAFQSVVVKMALHDRGVPLNHLSRPGHGFSESRFGRRYLNPIQTSVEDRFLRRRVVIQEGAEAPALRTLLGLLAQDEAVSIAYGAEARRLIEIPLFDGRLAVPSGPLNLSRLSGAPLLPVFCLQESSTAYTVAIEPPIDLPRHASREGALNAAARDYAAALERYVRAYPHLWAEWKTTWRP